MLTYFFINSNYTVPSETTLNYTYIPIISESTLNYTYIPGSSEFTNYTRFYNEFSGGIETNYNNKFGPGYIETIINTISHVGTKIIPKNSLDAITYDEILEGDILINFNRSTNKTEYDYDTYYKESTLKNILISKKNPFTMKELDLNSFTKYEAKF
jgi:hypothetical protein